MSRLRYMNVSNVTDFVEHVLHITVDLYCPYKIHQRHVDAATTSNIH